MFTEKQSKLDSELSSLTDHNAKLTTQTANLRALNDKLTQKIDLTDKHNIEMAKNTKAKIAELKSKLEKAEEKCENFEFDAERNRDDFLNE